MRLNLTIDPAMDPLLHDAVAKAPKRLRTERLKKLALIGLMIEANKIAEAAKVAESMKIEATPKQDLGGMTKNMTKPASKAKSNSRPTVDETYDGTNREMVMRDTQTPILDHQASSDMDSDMDDFEKQMRRALREGLK
jgi:hypothetical protein